MNIKLRFDPRKEVKLVLYNNRILGRESILIEAADILGFQVWKPREKSLLPMDAKLRLITFSP
jgi:hypothetical protein